MTLVPFAPSQAIFSPQIDYVFRVRRMTAPQPLTLDPTPLDITCAFVDGDGGAQPQTATCSAPGGMLGAVAVGDPSGGASATMRVFAGRRADPAFFDRQGTFATAASGRASFTGQNSFAGADVLAIVVEIDAATFRDAGTVMPMLAVAAETVRRGR
jgi:hypothetical protein